MKSRKFFLVGGIVLLVVVIVTAVVVGGLMSRRLEEQKKAAQKRESPFGEFTRIGGVSWEVGEIRLKWLRAEIRDKSMYLTGWYTDENGAIQNVQIFVGTVLDDGLIHLLTAIRDKEYKEIISGSVNHEDIVALFTKDREILVSFLISVPDYEKVITEGRFCDDLPKICALGERVIPFQWAYSNFWKNKVPPPGGIALNAITIIL